MLSTDCKKRVILAIAVLTVSLATFVTLAILGADNLLNLLPEDIHLEQSESG